MKNEKDNYKFECRFSLSFSRPWFLRYIWE